MYGYLKTPEQVKTSPIPPQSLVLKLKTVNLEDDYDVENKNDSHIAKSLVLNCMDFRIQEEVMTHMYGRSNAGDFDYFVLAGSSLGYNDSKHKHHSIDGSWAKSYEEHIKLAIKLHSITEIIIVDHMDCGFFAHIYGDKMTKMDEYKHHIDNVSDCIKTLMKLSITKPITHYVGFLVTEEKKDKWKTEKIYEKNV